MNEKLEPTFAFYFQLIIDDFELVFEEISGLEAEKQTVHEGGVREYSHVLPSAIKSHNLVLKKSLQPTEQSGLQWINTILEGNLQTPISTRTLFLKLMNTDGIPIYTWSFKNAYPVKWEIESQDQEKNIILIESLEFAYSEMKKL